MVVVMPVMMVPPAPVPVPMPMVPMAMVPMAAMMPAHLLGLQMIDVVLGNDGGFHRLGGRRHNRLMRHDRWQWRGIRRRSKRCDAGDRTKRE
jgi:hypothetical protein